MIQIGKFLISLDLFEVEFICDLDRCHGNCCVFGDAGAPLEDGEAELLDRIYDKISKHLSIQGRRAIEQQGKWVVDTDGEKVTPLINGKECAYTIFKKGIAFCGIEEAWEKGKVNFRKPVSCHLYPIRVGKVGEFTALNYHRWQICEPARILGKKKSQPVFRFLKDSITRVYGKDLYDEMEKVYEALQKKSGSQV